MILLTIRMMANISMTGSGKTWKKPLGMPVRVTEVIHPGFSSTLLRTGVLDYIKKRRQAKFSHSYFCSLMADAM